MFRTAIRTCFIGTLLFVLPIAQPSYSQYLHTSGKNIVDGDGAPVLLRGIGLGGWLFPEGYMLHIPGFGSPSSIHAKIVDLIGPLDAEIFYQAYQENYVNEKDIRQIANWGFNSIRLPFHYEMISPKDQPGVFLESGFQTIDRLLSWCKAYGLYLILDMHGAPGGQNAGNISDSDGVARLWTMPENQDRTVEIWRKIAERYANESWIGGYDLLNEPVLPQGHSSLELRDLFIRISQAIREVDNNHIIFIEGNWYATDFTNLTPPLLYGRNIVYSFHKYWNETDIGTIQYLINMRNQWNVPLWLGESGENSNAWFHAVTRLMEEQNIGWCWWTHKKIATTTSPLSSPIGSKYQTVLDYWNGAAGRPTPVSAREALMEMAHDLALERCDYLPGVLAALLDEDYGRTHKPLVDNVIPGAIDCVDYDLGDIHVAYYDKDYWQVPNSSEWNSGRCYRNDGVDIEESQDTQGAPYSIGWVEAGEWANYTVDVLAAGIYEVSFRIASISKAGQFRLLIDGQDLTGDIPVPNTNGYYNWKTLTLENVLLPLGRHTLRLYFTAGGFNINSMEFRLKTTTPVQEGESAVPIEYDLGQNYPNPFNPSTRIGYSLPAKGLISLAVYDVLGRKIKKLIDGSQEAGHHSAIWNGRDENGQILGAGVYFVVLRAAKRVVISRKMILLN